MTPEELFTRLAPSIFVVESLDSNGAVVSFGSGVVITPDHVVTNKHVIKHGVSFRVKYGMRTWPGRITHALPRHDLCQIGVEGLEAPAVPLRDSSNIIVGERVYAIGAPRGFDLTISEGLVSGLRKRGATNVIQTTAPISSGSSGGGLFDDEGRLIGITTYSIENGQSLNFALLANLVLTLKDHPYIEDIGAAGHDSESQAFELEGLASQKMGLGKYGEAVKLWRQALRLRPQNKDSWFNLGISYTLVGLCEDSIEAYQEAIRLEPELFHAWYWLGWTHELTKQYDKAIEAYKEAIRLKPDNVDAWVGLGEAYKGNQFPDEALKAYNEAIRLKPENDRAWLRLGTFHIQITRHYAEGISALREAARLEPDKADTWHWLAYAYHGQGDRERKLQALRRLESLDPKAARKFARDYK